MTTIQKKVQTMKRLSLLIILLSSLNAQLLLSPFDALKINFNEDITIEKKSILLSKAQAKAVQEHAKVKLNTKIYKTFKVTQKNQLLGYGVLVIQKVRTKNSAVLSIITPEGRLKSIEIIAFNEPPEYIPSSIWVDRFKGVQLDDTLKLGKNIPNISGATFSARSATDASRIALAIYEVAIKEQK
jgi:Na+-translocating ferredoxin:NAD+ oxidoreductase RnfG subunit